MCSPKEEGEEGEDADREDEGGEIGEEEEDDEDEGDGPGESSPLLEQGTIRDMDSSQFSHDYVGQIGIFFRVSHLIVHLSLVNIKVSLYRI